MRQPEANRLDGKVALVTGGASGLGKAMAARLQAEGACVVISDVQTVLGRAVAEEIGATFYTHDVSDEDQWRTTVDQVEHACGGLHVLVNNAGILGPKDGCSPESTRLADWHRIFAVNVEGVFLGCRAAIPAMRRSGSGSIVNISSVAGLLATPYATAYGASKAAVGQLSRSVAQHCADQGLKVRCNSVHPGDVRTPLLEASLAAAAVSRSIPLAEIVEERRRLSPLGDFILPEDVAAAVAFLASDDARHITGTALVVDGGVVGCDTYHMAAPARLRAREAHAP